MDLPMMMAELRDLKVYCFRLEPHLDFVKIQLYGFGDRPEGSNATPTWNAQATGKDPTEVFIAAVAAAVEARQGVSDRALQRYARGQSDVELSEPTGQGQRRPRAPKAKPASGPKLTGADLAKLMGL